MSDRPRQGDGSRAPLRIIATTDLHLHLLPLDSYTDAPRPATGLAQAATLIRALRAEAPGPCLLLDNGDLLQGSLLEDLLLREARDGTGGPHPMIAAMNALGFDAGCLGNHDLDHGLPWLRAALAQARFPVLSANILATQGPPLAPPWTILSRDLGGTPLRIGILGLGPPQVADWHALSLGRAIRVRDLLGAAAEEVPRLRAAGADLVVALCHSGIGGTDPQPFMENAAVPLAAIPGIDAVVAGHTHRVFPDASRPPAAAVDPRRGTLHGKPAVQPGAYGSHLGLIDLTLRREGGGWQVADHAVRAIPVPPDATPDPTVAAIAAPAQARLRAFADRPVGETRVPLHSFFARVAPSAALAVLADAQRAHATRLLAGLPEAGLPVLCAVAPARAGGRGGPSNYLDLRPGTLTFRQAAELLPHPNAFCLLEITGRALRDWLGRSARAFLTLAPGVPDQPLLDPEVPSYDFDVIDGLSWTFDLSRPPADPPDGPHAPRLRDLRHDGRPVADGDRFALATSGHRWGVLRAAVAGARVLSSDRTSLRDILLDHLRAGPLAPAPRPSWRISVPAGASARFDSGPGAAAHLPEAAGLGLAPLGPAPGGFLRFRLGA